MTVNNKLRISQEVYLITDPDQSPWMIIGILVTKQGLLYQCRRGSEVDDYYDFELSEIPIIKI